MLQQYNPKSVEEYHSDDHGGLSSMAHLSLLIDEISGESNLRKLKNKILVCLTRLVKADKIAFYFVRTQNFPTTDEKLFMNESPRNWDDSTEYFDTVLNDQMPSEYKAILNYVIETGRPVYISDSSKPNAELEKNDDFDLVLENISGFDVKSLLAMGFKDKKDIVQAVVKFKSFTASAFDNVNIKFLTMFLNHCGEAIANAKLFSMGMFENDRRKNLIESVPTLFDHHKSLEDIIEHMMKQSQRLFNSNRCTIFFRYKKRGSVDYKSEKNKIALTKVYDLLENENYRIMDKDQCDMIPKEIIEQVMETGKKLVIHDANLALKLTESVDKQVDENTIIPAKSIMCMPLRNMRDKSIIGCIRMTRKLESGYNFDWHDESLFEEFCQMFSVSISQKVQLKEFECSSLESQVKSEMLDYYRTPDKQLVEDFVHSLPVRLCSNERIYRRSYLASSIFDDYSLSDDEMVCASYKIFEFVDLFEQFKINKKTFLSWLLTVRKNYRDVYYHNWRHGFNCFQSMFAILENAGLARYIDDTMRLSLLIGCLGHDLDHRGTSNRFQHEVKSLLSQLYGTKSTMERHHINMFLEILNMPNNNILGELDSMTYKLVIDYSTEAILATDLVNYFSTKKQFELLVASSENNLVDWHLDSNNSLLRKNLMTFCDLASVAKPWRIQFRVVSCVLKEFFVQGEIERENLNIEPLEIMDPTKASEIPRLQIGWIDNVCLPLNLSIICPWFEQHTSRIKYNRRKWCTCRNEMRSMESFRLV